MAFWNDRESSRKRHASRGMSVKRTFYPDLTRSFQNVTINPNRGDKETQIEFQPHLNAGLWPGYLEQCEMEFMKENIPPSDGPLEAPGAVPPNPPIVPEP